MELFYDQISQRSRCGMFSLSLRHEIMVKMKNYYTSMQQMIWLDIVCTLHNKSAREREKMNCFYFFSSIHAHSCGIEILLELPIMYYIRICNALLNDLIKLTPKKNIFIPIECEIWRGEKTFDMLLVCSLSFYLARERSEMKNNNK
jgi:hypothetical protein